MIWRSFRSGSDILKTRMKTSRISTAILIVLLIGIGLVVAAGLVAWTQMQPADPDNQETQTFVVPQGQAVRVIADRLAAEGLIKQPLALRATLKLNGLEGRIQAGSFEVSPSMTLQQISEVLTSGTTDLWITIPEGWRREEIAQSLAQAELPAFDETEFLDISATSEGMLFPDTYLVPRQVTAAAIYDLLTNTFDQKVTQGLAAEYAASSRDPDEVLVMASLLEREARGYEEMRQVAGVLWKRIELGMPLQVDATLQYAKGYNAATGNWWTPPLGADRQLNSPFNTYQNPGLPPRPIANPGVDAVRAALNPAQTDYLFYIHDNQGGIHFAETLDQHNANVNRYLR